MVLLILFLAKFKGIKQLARNTDTSIQAEELKRILKEEEEQRGKIILGGNEKDIKRLSPTELEYLMDRSERVFQEQQETDLVRVAKPVTGDLNDTLIGM